LAATATEGKHDDAHPERCGGGDPGDDAGRAAGEKANPFNFSNFVRAESDLYFGRYVRVGAFGKSFDERAMTPIDKQESCG
jgi:hypothetical protein